MKYICCAHRGDACESSDCDSSSANSTRASTAAFFCSLVGLISHAFWGGDSGEEISTRWNCVEKINHLRDSWLFLGNDFTRFNTRRGLWYPLKCWNDRCFDFDNQCVWTLLLKKIGANYKRIFSQKYQQNLLLPHARSDVYARFYHNSLLF